MGRPPYFGTELPVLGGATPVRLLEREAFLRSLKGWMREAAAGAGRLVFVAGEAGVGKSALLRTFVEAVEGLARVAVGACDPLSTPRPLGPLLDVSAHARDTRRHLDAGARRAEVFQAFLRDIGSAPSVVIFEDCQWADEATLDLLRFLGRRIGTTRALLVVTYRDDEAGAHHPLTLALGDLATADPVRRMTLPRLTEAAVRALAQGSGLDPAELYRRTGGNPFFVTEILASGSLAIPATVRDFVLARASRLSSRAWRVLEAAAVIGVRFEPWLVGAVAGTEAGALDECVAAGMVHRHENVLIFRHELTREVILAAIPPQRALVLHRATLAALRSSSATRDDMPRLAHHAEAAGDGRAVLACAQEAARRAVAVGAHREAASQYAQALRWAQDLPLEAQAELRERLAYEYFLTARFQDAVDTHERALEHRRALGDRLQEGVSLCALSRILWCTGRIVEAGARAREAVELLEQFPPGHDLAMAYSAVSSVSMNAEDAESALLWGRRALELAQRIDDREVMVHALNNMGTIELLRGVPEGREKLERSMELARQADLEEHVGRAFIHLAWAAVRTRRFDLGDRVASGLEYCSARDLDLWRLWLLAYRSRLELDHGLWPEAADSARLVVAAHGGTLSRIPALCVLALIRARRGDGGARPLLDEALALAAPTQELQHLAPVAAARAEVAWVSGDPEAIDAATGPAFTRALEVRDPWTLGELAYWRWRAGCVREPPAGSSEPYALHLAGEWRRAAERWEEIGCPYEAAFALADSGDEEALRRSLGIFEGLGARPMARLTARRLREMGVRAVPRGPRPSTRAHPVGLTSRELEIISLIAQGLTNSEIAARCFVSAKTVDHHVSSILSKLSVRRRVDVAREAMRLGILQGPPRVAGPAS